MVVVVGGKAFKSFLEAGRGSLKDFLHLELKGTTVRGGPNPVPKVRSKETKPNMEIGGR